MMRASLLALLAAATSCFPAHSQTFTRLSFQDGKETTAAAGLRLQLHDPDNPASPTLWQGPLSISSGSVPCEAHVSLVRDVFVSSTGKLAVVVSISGSNTFVDFFNPHTCARKWPTLSAFSGGASVDGDRLSLLPACEAMGRTYSCSAASVLRLRDDVPPVRLPAASRALTRRTFGIAFTGSRTLLHPPTSVGAPR